MSDSTADEQGTGGGDVSSKPSARSIAMKKAWAKRKAAGTNRKSKSPRKAMRATVVDAAAVMEPRPNVADKVQAAESLLSLCGGDVKSATDCCKLVSQLQ